MKVIKKEEVAVWEVMRNSEGGAIYGKGWIIDINLLKEYLKNLLHDDYMNHKTTAHTVDTIINEVFREK